MAKILYSVRLTGDGKEIILDSLKNLFEIKYTKENTTLILDLIVEFSKVLANGHRIYLTSAHWLFVLLALREKFLVSHDYVLSPIVRFRILGVAAAIVKEIEKNEGEIAYTYKPFRFFACKR